MMGRFEPAEPLARYGICGTPWHGPVMSAQLTLPNGATMPYRQPTGDIHRGECAAWLLAVPGIPAVVRSEQEQLDDAAAGMQWRNVATISGDQMQLYGKPLGAGNWIYVDPDGGRWLVKSGLHGANVHTLAAAGKITLRLRRFGVIDGTTAADIEVEIPVGYTSFVSAGWASYPSNGDGSLPIRLGALHPAGAAAAWMVWRSLRASQPFSMTPLAWFELALSGVPGLTEPGKVFSASISVIEAEHALAPSPELPAEMWVPLYRGNWTWDEPPILTCPAPNSPTIEMQIITESIDVTGMSAFSTAGGFGRTWYAYRPYSTPVDRRITLGVHYDATGARSLVEGRLLHERWQTVGGSLTSLSGAGSLFYTCGGGSYGPNIIESSIAFTHTRQRTQRDRITLTITGAGPDLQYWYEWSSAHEVSVPSSGSWGGVVTDSSSATINSATTARKTNIPGMADVELDALAGDGYVAFDVGMIEHAAWLQSRWMSYEGVAWGAPGDVLVTGTQTHRLECLGLAAYSPSVWGCYTATSVVTLSPAPGSARFIGELATPVGRRSVADRVIAQANVLNISTDYWPYASLCPATGAIAWEAEKVCWV